MHTLKSSIYRMPPFFDRYILPVQEEDVLDGLEHSLAEFMSLDIALFHSIGTKTYAPGKWTIKEILQHITDNERIQSYRAMRFARNDKTVLPGYDEELLAAYSHANERSLEDLRDEFFHVRKATISMYTGFTAEAILRTGICFNTEITPLALGFVLIGHQRHHLNIIQERYIPLV